MLSTAAGVANASAGIGGGFLAALTAALGTSTAPAGTGAPVAVPAAAGADPTAAADALGNSPTAGVPATSAATAPAASANADGLVATSCEQAAPTASAEPHAQPDGTSASTPMSIAKDSYGRQHARMEAKSPAGRTPIFLPGLTAGLCSLPHRRVIPTMHT